MSWFFRGSRAPRHPALTLTPADCTSEEVLASSVAAQVDPFVHHQGLYVYWLDREGRAVHLRASRSAPATAGAGFDREEVAEVVPLTLERPADDQFRPRVWGSREDPWLDVPVTPWAVIRYRLPGGRRHSTLSPAQSEELARWARTGAHVLRMAHALVSAQHEQARLSGLIRSCQTALDAVFRPESTADLLLRLGTMPFGAIDAAMVAVSGSAGAWECLAACGQGREWWEAFRLAHGENRTHTLTESQWQPPGGAVHTVVAVPALVRDMPAGGLYLFLPAPPEWNEYRRAVLWTLGNRIGHLVAQEELARQAGPSYLAALCSLVYAIDGLTQQSLGHSDRLARYSRLIARELGLSPAQVEDVALAAFLHDVGMITLPSGLMFKSTRMTAAEYEQVKNHAEVGAQLVAPVQDSAPLAAMVAAHHERWDGRGFPRGLSREDIPLGARILAVADVFDAKTTGRTYRSGLPFSRALAEMLAAGGTQFDPQVVEALANAFRNLRHQAPSGRPVSPCWEIKQLPPEVCSSCPNRTPTAVACWENPVRFCHQHGDTCTTCLVFTEAVGGGTGIPPFNRGGGG